MSTILVSIIVPVYNAADYLSQCLDSIVGQTCRDIEVLLVNDGSTDASLSICEEYAARDRRIRVLSLFHGGAYAARNAGIDAAQGEYLVFFDADDFVEPNLCADVCAYARARGADVALYGGDVYDHGAGTFKSGAWMQDFSLALKDVFNRADAADELFMMIIGSPWGMMLRTEFVRREAIYFTALPSIEDVPLAYTALAAADRICTVDKTLFHLRRKAPKKGLVGQANFFPARLFQAYAELRRRLIGAGVYAELERSFVNRMATDLVGQHDSVLEDECARAFFVRWLACVAPLFGLTGRPTSYFLNERTGARLNELLAAGLAAVTGEQGVSGQRDRLPERIEPLFATTAEPAELLGALAALRDVLAPACGSPEESALLTTTLLEEMRHYVDAAPDGVAFRARYRFCAAHAGDLGIDGVPDIQEQTARWLDELVELAPEEYLTRHHGVADIHARQLLHAAQDIENGEGGARGALARRRECLGVWAAADGESIGGAPKVSVLIPACDVEKYVGLALQSVMGQSLRDIEVVCVDDGSHDRTLAVLLACAGNDGRVRIFSQENRGVSAARNAALGHARGEYVYFLDSDDLLVGEGLERMYARARTLGLDLLLVNGATFYDSPKMRDEYERGYGRRYVRKGPYADVLSGVELLAAMDGRHEANVQPCLQLVRRAFLEERGLTYREGIIHEDNLFSFSLILMAGRAGFMEYSPFLRRMRPSSIMTSGRSARTFVGYFTCLVALSLEITNGSLPKGADKALIRQLRGIYRTAKESLGLFGTVGSVEEAFPSLEGEDEVALAAWLYELLRADAPESAFVEGLLADAGGTDAPYAAAALRRTPSVLAATCGVLQRANDATEEARGEGALRARELAHARDEAARALEAAEKRRVEEAHAAQERLDAAMGDLAAARGESRKHADEAAAQKTRVAAAEKRTRALEQELATLRARCSAAEADAAAGCEEIERIHASATYRIGRAATWVPRAARKALGK